MDLPAELHGSTILRRPSKNDVGTSTPHNNGEEEGGDINLMCFETAAEKTSPTKRKESNNIRIEE